MNIKVIDKSIPLKNIKLEGTKDVLKLDEVQEIKYAIREHLLFVGLDSCNNIRDISLLGIGSSKNVIIDTKEIINKVRLERNDIAWMGIELKGTNAIVKIKEAEKAPEVLDENEYCDIVADKSGMITKINVQNGTATVKEGDIVETGDILVNGYIEGQYTGTRYVHSAATIEAKVWYTKKAREPLTQEVQVETGNTEKKYSIKFKKNQIN